MADVRTLNENVRTVIDGTESLRLATPGTNWRATLAAVFAALAPVGSAGGGGTATVNVLSFPGVDPTGVLDSTAGIQAAIDFAIAHQFQVIYMPPGTYKISNTLYLDPPGNMRVSGLANPTIFNFSLHLMGEPGGANNEGFGTIIAPTFKDKIAVLVGSGRAMMASHFHINGPAGNFYNGYRGAQSPTGAGLVIASQCSRTLIVCVQVSNFYTGFQTGIGGNANLADSNTFFKCLVVNAYQSFYFSQIENFVNTLYDCQAGGTISVNNLVSNNVNVDGGNYSASDSRHNALDMSGVSAIGSATDPGGDPYYYIDMSLTTADRPTYDALTIFSTGVFNRFVILTAHFGAVPLSFISSAVITHDGDFPSLMTARLRILDNWRKSVFINDTDVLPAFSDLQAELQAQTVLYCAEMVTTFYGADINAEGCHIENPDAVTCFVDAFAGWAPGRKTSVKKCLLNWEPSISGFNTPASPKQYAAFLVQQSHPFVRIGAGTVVISDCDAQNSTALPYDWDANFQSSRFVWQRNSLPPPNTRMGMRGGSFITANGQYTTNQNSMGGGEYDTCVTPAPGSGLFSDLGRGTQTLQNYWGYRPAANTRPMIMPSYLAVLMGTLPAIDWAHPGQNMITYQILWGGLPYNVFKALNDPRPFYGVVSDHFGWTVGQDLTYAGMAVSYKGKSNCVYMDATSMLMMFPGLIIILSDGTTDHKYMVNGIYNALGYVTVVLADSEFVGGGISGVKTTIYTATTIKQQPFALRFLDVAASVNYQVPTTGFNITLGNNDSDLVLQPAGTLATGTIQMCPAPYNTQRVSIRSSQVVTALTVSPNSGQSVAGAPTTLAVGVEKTAVYRAANTTWYFG